MVDEAKQHQENSLVIIGTQLRLGENEQEMFWKMVAWEGELWWKVIYSFNNLFNKNVLLARSKLAIPETEKTDKALVVILM